MALTDIFLPPVPLQRPTLPTDPNPESRLTPGQLAGLRYSRSRYADGSFLVDPPHSPLNKGDEYGITSFYGTNQPVDGGRQYANVPTFWNGKTVDEDTALRNAMDYERLTGTQFARYPAASGAHPWSNADWGEMQAVHPIMDADAQRILQIPGITQRTPEALAQVAAMFRRGGR